MRSGCYDRRSASRSLRGGRRLTEALVAELERLNRWREHPLPADAFENMGAFGENTMAFEEWIQFVLVPRLRGIVREREEFPSGSQLAVYAVRALDGDADAERLHELLDALDRLVQRVNGGTDTEEGEEPAESAPTDTRRSRRRALPPRRSDEEIPGGTPTLVRAMRAGMWTYANSSSSLVPPMRRLG